MPEATGKGSKSTKSKLRYTDLTQVSATGGHLQRFGDDVGNHTDRLNTVLDRISNSAKRDKSGLGSILSKAFTGAGKVLGKAGKESGRVIKRSGDNVHITATSHRHNEHDNRRIFDDIHLDSPKKKVTFADASDGHGNNQPPKVRKPPLPDSNKTAGNLYHKTTPASDKSHPLKHGYDDSPETYHARPTDTYRENPKAQHPEIIRRSKDVATELRNYQKEIEKKNKPIKKEIKELKKNNKDTARKEAEVVKPPSMGGAAIFGDSVSGHSSMTGGAPNHHPLVKSLLDDLDHKVQNEDAYTGHQGVGHGHCAEVGSISDYLHKNDPEGKWSLKDAREHFDHVGGATQANSSNARRDDREPCASCDHLTQKLGIHGMDAVTEEGSNVPRTPRPWHQPLNDTPANETPAHNPPDHRTARPGGGILKK